MGWIGVSTIGKEDYRHFGKSSVSPERVLEAYIYTIGLERRKFIAAVPVKLPSQPDWWQEVGKNQTISLWRMLDGY